MRLECQNTSCVSHNKDLEQRFDVKMTVTCTSDYRVSAEEIEYDLVLGGFDLGLVFECHYCNTQHVHPEEDEDGTAQTAAN